MAKLLNYFVLQMILWAGNSFFKYNSLRKKQHPVFLLGNNKWCKSHLYLIYTIYFCGK